jgi:8-oxo-dGTP diphosphatase
MANGDPTEAFCPRCGAPWRLPPSGSRLHCRRCGGVTYRNPAVGVAVVVLQEGRVLLGRRARGPFAGRWCIPCGYVEWGEDVRAAARREFLEETGLTVEIGEVAAVHSNFHDAGKLTVGIWFHGRIAGGEPIAGDDLDLVSFSAFDHLPPLAFPTDEIVLAELAKKAKA